MTAASDTTVTGTALPDAGRVARRRRWRMRIDRWTAAAMASGGVAVIVALLLIFFYLLYVVWPLFEPARIAPVASVTAPGGGRTLALLGEEYRELGLRVSDRGEATFFRLADGEPVLTERLLPQGAPATTAFAAGDPASGVFALGLADGSALVLAHAYTIDYPQDRRRITPRIERPFGSGPVRLLAGGEAVRLLAAQAVEDEAVLVAVGAGGAATVTRLTREESLLGDEVTVEADSGPLPLDGAEPARLALSKDLRTLYLLTTDNVLRYYDVTDAHAVRLVDQQPVAPRGIEVGAMTFLAGGISLVTGDATGRIVQWFAVRDEGNRYRLARVRDWQAQHAPIRMLVPEHHRKGFAALADDGTLGLYHATAHRTLLVQPVDGGEAAVAATFTPRADGLVYQDRAGTVRTLAMHNQHPEVSWSALWGKVWYESRAQPEYIWQSSSASSDFEPKFSLTPLALGTLKATLYAMLFAVPLALTGAIFTAYFMARRMRAVVKPTVEVMAALPTVVLGFLAGLWLAPLVERHLPGVFLMFLAVPAAALLAAWAWSRLPSSWRHRLPEGWEAALLLPVVVAAVWASLAASGPIEVLAFGGDAPAWLSQRLGIPYDQRNSLVVGIAMGFAVIPTIFSISEDAIFSVPRHLTRGSLALGATTWQTLTRVVLLTASPGIFSALMIGLGRAVGETMIVLMATGNTPVTNFNIFQGFRALSANIAVEMPEAEVASTHYRILFLAGLVLFIATFVFNTGGELVRQRLRARYSSL